MPMTEIRRANSEDATACAESMQEWLDSTPWVPDLHTLNESVNFCRNFVIEKCETYVLGTPAKGFIAIESDQIILAFYVSNKHRSQQVGQRLLDHAKSLHARLTLWVFEQNEGARRFYERHGFVATGRTDSQNDEGLPDLEMAWCR